MKTLRRERLVDELVEAYIDWRETCGRVNDAYRSWAAETGSHGRVAFELYTAALDAEERTAADKGSRASAGAGAYRAKNPDRPARPEAPVPQLCPRRQRARATHGARRRIDERDGADRDAWTLGHAGESDRRRFVRVR